MTRVEGVPTGKEQLMMKHANSGDAKFGALVGAILGGMIGFALSPVIGTVIGVVLGAVVGAVLGAFARVIGMPPIWWS